MSRTRWSLAVFAGAVSLLAPASAGAVTIPVTTTIDEYNQNPGACSLREAVESANNDSNANADGCLAGSGTDVVALEPDSLYGLARVGADGFNVVGDLDIETDSLTIEGAPGAVIEGNGATTGDRAVELPNFAPGVEVTITDVTIRGGGTDTVGSGGGIGVNGITNGGNALTLKNVTIEDNRAITGGGVKVGDLSLLLIVNSTISGNHALVDGGGISNDGDIEIHNATLSANQADSNDDTFGEGGGLNNNTGNPGAESAHTLNTIIAGNSDGTGGTVAPDCEGSDIVSVSTTLVGDTTGCAIATDSGDITDRDPKLAPLADNGGGALTHALLGDSPAVDAGSTGNGAQNCAPTDQRGLARSLGGECDLGAYERVLCAGAAVNRIGTAGSETMIGTSAADVFLLFGGGDAVRGRKGADRACGGGGRDRLVGGPGRDRLLGQAGGDILRGGTGNDRLLGGRGPDRIKGGKGRDRCKGGPGRDRVRGC